MTGPEHYRQAERLLAAAIHRETIDQTSVRIAEAQVHATLALAAATANGRSASTEDARAWREATGGGQGKPPTTLSDRTSAVQALRKRAQEADPDTPR